MAISIGPLLDGDLKGNFRGAVFLTYTLDLNFFEELIAPKLDALGCTNVVILVDRYGYDEALARQATRLAGVGRRYLCVPIDQTNGEGVQHVKTIFLAGPQEGCLLLGSGNLTLHGTGRNMEQFTRFDLKLDSDTRVAPAALYPFTSLWKLIRSLEHDGSFSETAVERLNVIESIAPWLHEAISTPTGAAIWDSYDRSLFSRLRQAEPLEELQIISPFHSLSAIKSLMQALQPNRLVLGVDAAAPSLDGPALVHYCQEVDCQLHVRALDGRSEDGTRERRPLHAKTYVGITQGGSWCASGSANCSERALFQSWRSGGNLELLVWQQVDDPHAFDRIWEDELIAWHEIDPRSASIESEDQPPEANDYPLRLLEMTFENDTVRGRFIPADTMQYHEQIELELLRMRRLIPLQYSDAGAFSVSLAGPIDFTEAGRLVAIESGKTVPLTSFRWVDQPRLLARHGNRSYHARIGASLQTFAGSGALFEELMNFLWNRVDPQEIQQADEDDPGRWRTRKRRRDDDRSQHSQREAPPPEAFVTEENLSETLAWHVTDYLPHDRSNLTLRDLLSLTLLRLTTAVERPDSEPEDGQPEDTPTLQQDSEQDAQRKQILESLRTYLIRYCRRYATRLTEAAFVVSTGPQLLFENHYTLGRVLLEFAAKTSLFTDEDLRQNALLLLASMFWPSAVGLPGSGAWARLHHSLDSTAELRGVWEAAKLTPLTAVLIAEGWAEPPQWTRGIHRPAVVQRYLLVQELLRRLERFLGERFWRSVKDTPLDEQALWGFRNLSDLESDERVYPLSDAVDVLDRLRDYRTPVEEKYWALFAWWRRRLHGHEHSPVAVKLMEYIKESGQAAELQMLQKLPATTSLAPLQPDDEYCPRCFVKFPSVDLRFLQAGNLKLCPNCSSVVVYRRATLKLPIKLH